MNPAELKPLTDTDQRYVLNMAQSIQTLGIITPVVITPDNKVIDGLKRTRAAILLGLKDIPTLVIDSKFPPELLRLAMNYMAPYKDWVEYGTLIDRVGEVDLIVEAGLDRDMVAPFLEHYYNVKSGKNDPNLVLPL